MDVYCPRCSEPWDIDTFHDAADEQDSTFQKVRADFAKRGCIAIGWQANPCVPDGSLRALASREIMDLLGDDIDGAASLLDDFEYAGLFD